MNLISQIKKDLAKNPDAEMLFRVLDVSKVRGPSAICPFILDVHGRQELSQRRSAELMRVCLKATQYPALRDISTEDAMVHCARALLWATQGTNVDCLSHIGKCPIELINVLADKITNSATCEYALDDYCVLLHKTLRMSVVKFTFGTVEAHVALDQKRSELVVHAIVNRDTGNGNFQAFLVWLKAKCSAEGLNLVFADIINDRLCVHLQNNHGFKLRKPRQGVFKEVFLKLKQNTHFKPSDHTWKSLMNTSPEGQGQNQTDLSQL